MLTNHQLTDKLNLSATLYNRNATVLKNTVYYVVDTAQISFYRPNNLTGIESILNYNLLANVSLTSGLVFEYEQLAEGPTITQSNSSLLKPPTPEKPTMDNNFLASVFIEPRFILFDHLYLSGGLRFDQSTVYNQVITPRAGIRYNAGKHSVRISYAEAYRAPKPWDYSDGIGNTDLIPERMKSLEASIMLMVSKSMKIDLTAYQNRLENGIIKELVNDDYRWTNSSEFNTNGFEVYARYSTRKIKSTINYTLTNSLDENEQFLPEISKHTANASLTYLFSKSWKLNLRANYVGKRKNPSLIETTNNYVIDPFLILNGALTWIYSEKITCQLTGKNLLNSEYYHSSNRSPNRYRQAQRTMLFSVVYHFDH
ncbi:MAG: TonB-dependent receptor [Prolixibacteraceae bacterium]|jgi:outer membrane receptor for ferrienterochelin and colicin|nr:TonB-dependent receptor [Prolixibacteraceae bacterium]